MKRVLWSALVACLLCASLVSASHHTTAVQTGDDDDVTVGPCVLDPDYCIN